MQLCCIYSNSEPLQERAILKGKRIRVQFLGEKVEVAKIQHVLHAFLEARVVEVRKKIEKRVAYYPFGGYSALQLHPLVPLVDFEVAVEDDDS